jgi:hypothetical protein
MMDIDSAVVKFFDGAHRCFAARADVRAAVARLAATRATRVTRCSVSQSISRRDTSDPHAAAHRDSNRDRHGHRRPRTSV